MIDLCEPGQKKILITCSTPALYGYVMGRSGPLQSKVQWMRTDQADVVVGKGNMEPLRVSDLSGLPLPAAHCNRNCATSCQAKLD